MFVVAGFEVVMMLQGQQTSGMAARQVVLMLAVCSLVMFAISAMLFFTALLEKMSARIPMGIGAVLAMARVDCAGCQPCGVFHVLEPEAHCCRH